MTLRTLLLCILVVISPGTALAEQEMPAEVAARLQQRYDQLTSLSFNFHQDTRGEVAGRPRRANGHAIFYKNGDDGRMRWDYETPDKQILISDGEEFFMYFESLKQQIISPAEAMEGDLTYSFFTGKGKLARDFHIIAAEEEFQPEQSNELAVIKLVPREQQSQVQDIHLWVGQDSLLRRIQLKDHFGTITILNFTDIEVGILDDKTNDELNGLFAYTPPAGTEIIRQ